MNPTEQKAHTKATDGLAKRLDDLELIVTALDERVSSVATAAQASIGNERTARLDLAEAQRGYVDLQDRELRRAITWLGEGLHELRERTLWGRLRWICFGR